MINTTHTNFLVCCEETSCGHRSVVYTLSKNSTDSGPTMYIVATTLWSLNVSEIVVVGVCCTFCMSGLIICVWVCVSVSVRRLSNARMCEVRVGDNSRVVAASSQSTE